MVVRLTEGNFEQEVLQSESPVLVDFWAEWCMPCRMVAPAVESIAEEYNGKVKVCKLNVDEASQIASRYKVMSIPTLGLFVNGELVDKIVGAVPKTEIVNLIEKYTG